MKKANGRGRHSIEIRKEGEGEREMKKANGGAVEGKKE